MPDLRAEIVATEWGGVFYLGQRSTPRARALC